jgi:hypothetical protein
MIKLTKNVIVGIVILILVLSLLFAVITTRLIEKNNECVKDPFKYIAGNLEKKGMPVICTCNPLDPHYAPFYFDSNGTYINRNEEIDFNSSQDYQLNP